MKLGESLIDKASKVCGSDAALARRMGIYPADVSNLRTGKRPLSPELAAEIADIAGEDARQAAIDAVIERARGTRKENTLREILGKALAAGVAAMLVISYNGDSISATEKIAIDTSTIAQAIHRIYSVLRRWARLALRCVAITRCA